MNSLYKYNGWISFIGGRSHYVDGIIHNDNGPAVIHNNGPSFWYQNGKIHREDGPAIHHANGVGSWYYKGVHFPSEDEFHKYVKFKAFL